MNIGEKYPLLVKPMSGTGVYQSITREVAGWQYLNIQAMILRNVGIWEGNTGDYEYYLNLLTGRLSLRLIRQNPTIYGYSMDGSQKVPEYLWSHLN
jgi:5-deoxy-D-glucuronate isomerase